MDKMNLYTFNGGVEGLARMAAQASILRIDMSKTFTMADKLFDPEKAIDMAASLQRLGVTQTALLDPLKLMDLAQNDPEELQNQIVEMTKSFGKLNETTGKFEIPSFARRQLKEIEESLGYSRGELSKMAVGAVEFENKMSKITFPDTFSKEQREMIANMAELKDGVYTLRLGTKDVPIDEALQKLSDKNSQDYKEFTEASKPKTLEELQRESLPYTKQMAADIATLANRTGYGLSTTSAAETALKETANYIKELTGPNKFGGILKDKDIGQKFDTIDFNAALEAIKKGLLDPNQGLTKTLEELKKSGNEFTTYVSDELSKGLEMIKKELEKTFSAEEMNQIKNRLHELGVAFNSFLGGIGGGQAQHGDSGGGQAQHGGSGQAQHGQDVTISANGKNIKLLPEDTIFAGTSSDSLPFKIVEAMKSTASSSLPTETNLNINHRISFDNVPNGINENNLIAHLEKVMNNITLQTSMAESMKTIGKNYGLT